MSEVTNQNIQRLFVSAAICSSIGSFVYAANETTLSPSESDAYSSYEDCQLANRTTAQDVPQECIKDADYPTRTEQLADTATKLTSFGLIGTSVAMTLSGGALLYSRRRPQDPRQSSITY